MRQAIYANPLPEWEVNGVKYTAAEPIQRFAPVEFDGHFSLTVGRLSPLPGSIDVQRIIAARFARQSKDESQPRLQRFALEIREEPDTGDEIMRYLADVPVVREGKPVVSEDLAAALKERDARLEALEAENHKLRDEIEKKSKPHAHGHAKK